MYVKYILPVVAFAILFVSPINVSAQVPVEVSTEKVVTGGKAYYMHEVQKSQTLYSISRAYRVTIASIEGENIIPPNGIQTGQVLKIPVPDQAAPVAQPRQVQPRQTPPPATAARPATTATATDHSGITISGEKIVSGGRTYYMHEVKRGETLYSLARAYRVTILDIDRENIIPPGGIQAGQILKIPGATALAVTGEREQTAAETTDSRLAGRQETQLPRQETQLPRQEQPTAHEQPPVKELPVAEERGSEQTQKREQEADQQRVTDESETTVRQAVKPEKKKIHKVQKGESLSSIAKKYGITVQELKRANRGVIFAMPDMRLVIPVSDAEDQE